MSSLLRHSCAALLLAGLSASCVLAVDTADGKDKQANSKSATSAGKPEGATSESATSDGKTVVAGVPLSESETKKAARKAEKKERTVTYARMELALAEMDAELELRDARLDLERASQGLQAAQRELDHFTKVERPLELEDQQMDVERSAESALEQKQELEELMKMYKAEDFAKMTKELVLQRGKFQMDMAQRESDLTKKRAADKQAHALAVKELELSLALKKAQDGVNSAESKLKKTQAKNELELMRARHKLDDSQKPDEDEDEAAAKGASKGA